MFTRGIGFWRIPICHLACHLAELWHHDMIPDRHNWISVVSSQHVLSMVSQHLSCWCFFWLGRTELEGGTKKLRAHISHKTWWFFNWWNHPLGKPLVIWEIEKWWPTLVMHKILFTTIGNLCGFHIDSLQNFVYHIGHALNFYLCLPGVLPAVAQRRQRASRKAGGVCCGLQFPSCMVGKKHPISP